MPTSQGLACPVSLSEQWHDDGQKSRALFNEVNEDSSIDSNASGTQVGD
jgi:hypothetical protein